MSNNTSYDLPDHSYLTFAIANNPAMKQLVFNDSNVIAAVYDILEQSHTISDFCTHAYQSKYWSILLDSSEPDSLLEASVICIMSFIWQDAERISTLLSNNRYYYITDDRPFYKSAGCSDMMVVMIYSMMKHVFG